MRAPALCCVPLLLTLALAGCTGGGNINWTEDEGGNDVSGPALLSVGITLIDFGSVSYGQTYSEQIFVENVGGSDLVMSVITATSPFTANYSTDVTVTPGGSTTLVVRYQPTEYADHEGSFSFYWNGETSAVDTASSVVGDSIAYELPLYGAVITDEDDDGHDCEGAGGDDCDDNDDRVYPGAAEEWYDGEDQDCAGDDDYDQDGDGYQTDWYEPDYADGGADCNDSNPDVYYGAPDEWYDNVDSNCDGLDDWDQDRDGYKTTLGDRGNDCDDTDDDINPGEEEDASNGIDDDCDGRIDEE